MAWRMGEISSFPWGVMGESTTGKPAVRISLPAMSPWRDKDPRKPRSECWNLIKISGFMLGRQEQGTGKVAEVKPGWQPGLPDGFINLENWVLLQSVISMMGGEHLLHPSTQSERKPGKTSTPSHAWHTVEGTSDPSQRHVNLNKLLTILTIKQPGPSYDQGKSIHYRSGDISLSFFATLLQCKTMVQIDFKWSKT